MNFLPKVRVLLQIWVEVLIGKKITQIWVNYQNLSQLPKFGEIFAAQNNFFPRIYEEQDWVALMSKPIALF